MELMVTCFRCGGQGLRLTAEKQADIVDQALNIRPFENLTPNKLKQWAVYRSETIASNIILSTTI